jgi:hypothetical protein
MAVEKREQVFVSSTFKDLIDERAAVTQTLLEADCIPAGMEMFPASDDDKFDLIKRVIDLCDYYVVIVGGRYGSVDPVEELSYTEMEYDYAVDTGTPVMAFLHGDPGKLPGEKLDMDKDLREKLEAFRGKAEQRMVKFWNDPGDLKGQVALAMIQIRKSHPAEGWIRASHAMTPETERELAELRQRVAELTNALGDEKRHHRLEDTTDLAQGDDPVMLDAIVDYHSKKNVDAGTAYADRRLRARGDFETSWNDILAYIGPSLMDECTERHMSSEIDALAYKIAEDETDRIPDFGTLMEVEVTGECFDGIKVQLNALNLIERSTDRKRPVSDSATYWRLTEHGHDALMRLRAVRRSDEKAERKPLEDAD